jgi:hypothetical protein
MVWQPSLEIEIEPPTDDLTPSAQMVYSVKIGDERPGGEELFGRTSANTQFGMNRVTLYAGDLCTVGAFAVRGGSFRLTMRAVDLAGNESAPHVVRVDAQASVERASDDAGSDASVTTQPDSAAPALDAAVVIDRPAARPSRSGCSL